jgi:uncharacterized protein YndB with AHSA1/START domain
MKLNNSFIFQVPVEKVFSASIATAWRTMAWLEKLMQWWGENVVYHMTQVEHELRAGVHVKYAGRFAAAVQGSREG